MKGKMHHILAGSCVLCFIGAQAFQELAYRLWIPSTANAEGDLANYLLRVDEARALLVGSSILLLIVPFAVLALRYHEVAPLTSLLAFTFGAGFVALETIERSIDFFVVGRIWAHQFLETSATNRLHVLNEFTKWNQIVQGWYFPLLLSFLLASCCFAVVTWSDHGLGKWYLLAPLAFTLNVFRLLGRILSSFAGQSWLNGLNGKLYFPAVLLINGLLATWFFYVAREPDSAQSNI